MEITNIKKHRLYKSDSGARIMVRLCFLKAEGSCVLNNFYQILQEKYFSSAERFIECRTDKGTYFLDVKCNIADRGKNVKIKRSSTLKCGASLLKEETVFDVFDSELKRIKK